MKRFFLLLPFILFAINSYSQETGTITGTVVDRDSRAPLFPAAVTLFGSSDSALISGTETNDQGVFILDNISPGSYRLEVSFIGYSTAIVRGITVATENLNVNAGTIQLRSGITTTEEIEVESETPPVQFLPDKKVFNVEQSMVTRGGSVTDLLRNVPGVTVDSEGNVSLRGSENVRILLNGRPSGLDGPNRANILQQLNADDIESIELITNPSAKYEAEGVSGIINIIMKKNTGFGYNGSIMLNAGTNDKYAGSLNLNMRNEKFNLYGDYSYRMFNFDLDGFTNRTTFFNNSTSYFNQNNLGDMRFGGHNVRLGLDYFLSERQTIGLSGRYNTRTRKRIEEIENFYFDSDSSLTEHNLRDINNEDLSDEFEATLSYNNNFKNKGQTLSGEFSFEKETADDISFSNEYIIFPAGTSPENIRETQDESSMGVDGKIDYAHPFNENRKIEAGMKFNFNKDDDNYLAEFIDSASGNYVVDPALTRDFIYEQMVNSAYATFTDQIGNFGYQLGLRGEQTIVNGEVSTTTEKINQNYFSVFPSVSLSQKLGETEEIQLTYARRIQRPRSRTLNPFRNISDPNNIQQGNPNLRPEYTDSYELSFIKYFNNIVVTPSIFFRNSTDEITRIRTLIDSTVTLTTFDNLQESKTYGGELLINANISRIFTANGSVSYYRRDITGGSLLPGQENSNYSWDGRLMSNLRLPDLFDLQAMYFYSGERVTPQATIDPFHSLDLALSKNFFDNKATLGIRVSDVFNSAKMNIRFRDVNFIETTDRHRDSRSFFVTFTYRIGEEKRQQRRRTQEEPQDDEGMDF